jgi:hypothetical protein
MTPDTRQLEPAPASADGAWVSRTFAQFGISSALLLALALVCYPSIVLLPTALIRSSIARAAVAGQPNRSAATAGEEQIFPAKTNAALSLLRAHKTTEFQLSPALDADFIVRQRLAEGAYPIKMVKSARHWIGLTTEPVPPRCSIVETNKEIALALCQ